VDDHTSHIAGCSLWDEKRARCTLHIHAAPAFQRLLPPTLICRQLRRFPHCHCYHYRLEYTAQQLHVTENKSKKTKQNKTSKTKTKNKHNIKKETNKHTANKQSKTNKLTCCCCVRCGSTTSKTIIKTYRKQTNKQTNKQPNIKQTHSNQTKQNKQRKMLLQHKANKHTKQTTCNKQTKTKQSAKVKPCANFFNVFVVHPHSRCAFLNERHNLFFFAGRCVDFSLRLIIISIGCVLYFPPATSFALALPSMCHRSCHRRNSKNVHPQGIGCS
jgi:hypothetical protein